MSGYIHGYTDREARRLREQSGILEDLLHGGIHFPPGFRVLEAGCGVGAQTLILCSRNPGAEFISVDLSAESLKKARSAARDGGMTNVEFLQGDILDLRFPDHSFDCVFVCFVLEHVGKPDLALKELKRVLKFGGTLTAIEGDHNSCLWQPGNKASSRMWRAMIEVQKRLGQNPFIGLGLYSLMKRAGFEDIKVEPRPVYVDSGNQTTKRDALYKILVPMAQTARDKALEMELISETDWDKGITEFTRVAESDDGALFYTWFKGSGMKRS